MCPKANKQAKKKKNFKFMFCNFQDGRSPGRIYTLMNDATFKKFYNWKNN